MTKMETKSKKTIAISGGFDPVHAGHITMIEKASHLGNVVIILNNDNWLMTKKGYTFMNELDRARIMYNIKGVTEVYITKHTENDPDRTVCSALREIKPDMFGNGGDRKPGTTPEVELCNELGIELVWNLDDSSTRDIHSSDLVKHAQNCIDKIEGEKNAIS